MSSPAPSRAWWTPAEIAAAGLPDLPATRQGVDALARRQDWRADPTRARRRSGRGGGWEYSWKLFPARAQAELLKPATSATEPAARLERADAWAWFEDQPEKAKAAARERLAILQQVEALETPLGRAVAVATVARSGSVAARTIWNWLGLVEGVDAADRLAYLAPRYRATAPERPRSDCSPEFFDRLRADYLRLERPSFTASYRQAVRLAQANGWTALEMRTARRRIEEIPRVRRVLAREGVVGLERCFPPQIRDRSQMVAMETSALAAEIGADAVAWLAARFAGTKVDVPSIRGGESQRRASLLRAAIIEAGLTNPSRSANDLAREHGVAPMWVRKLRAELRRDAGVESAQLSLFDCPPEPHPTAPVYIIYSVWHPGA